VAERDELKLGPRRGQAAQQDAPEAATLLHLSEDRLDDRLAHLVQRPAFDARELVPHLFPLFSGSSRGALLPSNEIVTTERCRALPDWLLGDWASRHGVDAVEPVRESRSPLDVLCAPW